MHRPFVTLKCAATLDGYLDDDSPERLIISSPEDKAEVERLRAEHDAVLIGGETLRKDNPTLAGVKIKAVLTRSGNVQKDAEIFKAGKVLLFTDRVGELKQGFGGQAEVHPSDDALASVLETLYRTGVRKLLVEGGATVLALFLKTGLFDALRLAVSPKVLATRGAARLNLPPSPLSLVSVKALGDVYAVELRSEADS